MSGAEKKTRASSRARKACSPAPDKLTSESSPSRRSLPPMTSKRGYSRRCEHRPSKSSHLTRAARPAGSYHDAQPGVTSYSRRPCQMPGNEAPHSRNAWDALLPRQGRPRVLEHATGIELIGRSTDPGPPSPSAPRTPSVGANLPAALGSELLRADSMCAARLG
jgi:hypothetical protein